MQITAAMVKELRERSGSGIMDCKKALKECEGNFDKAFELLRQKGAASAEKRAGRATEEGLVGSYVHAGSRIGVLIEVNCETDFVANTDQFKQLVKDLAMQVAASAPGWVTPDEVPEEIIKKERGILAGQDDMKGKPEQVIEKILDGRIKKFLSRLCLLEQDYVKDPSRKVSERIQDAIAQLGENISVRRFARFEVGG